MAVTVQRRPQHLDRLLSRHGHRVCSGVFLACWATFAAAGFAALQRGRQYLVEWKPILGKSAPPFAWAPFELIGDWK